EGKVSQVIGAVVDVEFPPGKVPNIMDAVIVHTKSGREVVMEVEQEIGDNSVRCIAMDSTDGFRRGDMVASTGRPIAVPVGVETLGRMFNVIGEAIDDEPTPTDVERWPIHRAAPSVEDQQTAVEILETGIKVIDLLCTFVKGSKIGLFVGADVLVFIDNIFRCMLAGSEVSALLGRMPSAVGYQPTLATEMGALQERITSTKKGSITSVQAIYVPADDMTDPAIQTTFAHLGAIVTLSRALTEIGIYPAVDPLDSTSRFLDARIVGRDHYEAAQGVKRTMQRYKELQDIIAI